MIRILVTDPFSAEAVRIQLDDVDVTERWVSVRLLADGRALLDMCRVDERGRVVPGIIGQQSIGPYTIEVVPPAPRKAGWPTIPGGA